MPIHIFAEDHIPPVLDASAEAITDSTCDIESISVVTIDERIRSNNLHAENATAATELPVVEVQHSFDNPWANSSELAIEPGSPYARADEAKRLSFFSYADLVSIETPGVGAPTNIHSIPKSSHSSPSNTAASNTQSPATESMSLSGILDPGTAGSNEKEPNHTITPITGEITQSLGETLRENAEHVTLQDPVTMDFDNPWSNN